MTPKYDIRTVYPILQTHLPVTIKILFDKDDNTQPSQFARVTASAQHREGARLLVPKPPGQAGSISRGGYSLERHLNWEPTEYANVQRYVRERIKHHILQGNLKRGCPISKQQQEVIQIVQGEVAAKYPILQHYQDNWPTRDMISRYLSKASR